MTDNELLLAISNAVQEQIKSLHDDISTIKQKVTAIELTLENETNRNIMRVAEGHLDLSRKLDETLKLTMKKKCLQFGSIYSKASYSK